jgi:membrane associated rhomboid family serine protease
MLPLRDRLPRRRAPIVNWLLIAANVVVFLWERAVIGLGYPAQRLLYDWGLVPAWLVRHPVEGAANVLTSMFMHDPAGWYHIGGNMLFLWIFGDNVEDALGRGRYLAFYLLSGLAAAAAQVMIDPTSPVPMVGASGAIAGVLAAYGSLYPRSPVTVLNPVLPLWLFFGPLLELPAWLVILEFFVVNLFSGLGAGLSGVSGGVAFFAHIGGFVAGLFLVRLLLPAQPPRRDAPRWSGFRVPPRLVDPRSASGAPVMGPEPHRPPWRS